MELEIDQNYSLAVKTRVKGANITIIPLEKESISVEILDGWVSDSYGVKKRAPVVNYSKISNSPTFCNIIYPYKGEVSTDKIIKKLLESKVLRKVKATLT